MECDQYKRINWLIHLKARKYIGWYGLVWADLPDLKQECWLLLLKAAENNPAVLTEPGLTAEAIKCDLKNLVEAKSRACAVEAEVGRAEQCDIAGAICIAVDLERMLVRLSCAEQELVEFFEDGFNITEISRITGELRKTLDNRQKKLWRMLK